VKTPHSSNLGIVMNSSNQQQSNCTITENVFNSIVSRLDKLEKDSTLTREFTTSWSGKVWGINSTIAVVVSALAFLVNHFWNK
jgi:hypothetical protein